MTSQQIVDFLNAAAKCDAGAIHALCANRVPWHGVGDERLPLVVENAQKGRLSVGMLGVLNGIASLDGEIIEIMFTDPDPKLPYPENQPQFIGFRLRSKE
jgi:hypothetical protein